SIILGILG
nr:Chain A, ribifolin [Jatropha]